MKLINVTGDEDYAVIDFENSAIGKRPLQEIYDIVSLEFHGEYIEEDSDGFESFTITAFA